MPAFLVVRLRSEENPIVGATVLRIDGIVSNSYSTDVDKVEKLANEMNAKEKSHNIKYKVEQVGEYEPTE